MSSVIELLKLLIRCPSLTPFDAGCQEILRERLRKINFNCETLRFGDVENLWARFGTARPLFVFAGHTDVVPTGPVDGWQSPPFEPTIRGDFLYGRGATDMKSGLAAMIIAAENFIKKNPLFEGSIAFLVTSDEEGPSTEGTQKVMEELIKRQEKIDYCIVGEATSEIFLGDQIRVGRRGSLHGKLTIIGKQGHVAFPQHAKNPIHLCAKIIADLTREVWDEGNEFFPPTSFQISNIHGGTGALNVIPNHVDIIFNFRFGTGSTVASLQKRVTDLLEKNKLDFDLQWTLAAEPFLTKKGKLITATQQAIQVITDLEPVLSTGGGTSDARFIAPTGAEVLELGPCNTSAHQVDEHVRIADLEKLPKIYERILDLVFGNGK